MHTQNRRGLLGATATREEGAERAQELGAMLPVVIDQRSERVIVKAAQLGKVAGGKEQAIDTKILESSHLAGPIEPARHGQCLFSFLVRLPDTGGSGVDCAGAERDNTAHPGTVLADKLLLE